MLRITEVVLDLRLPRQLYEGKQKYLTLGLDDTPGNRAIAQAKAKQIESDIIYERFDLTLNKYRPGHMRMVNAEQTETFTDKNLKKVWKDICSNQEEQLCSWYLEERLYGYDQPPEQMPL